MDFLTKFKAAYRVSTPLAMIRTVDAKSTTDHIKTLWPNEKDGWKLILWDCVQGLTPLTKNGGIALEKACTDAGTQKEMTGPIGEALRVCASIGEDCIIFISNAQMTWNDGDRATVIQGIWNLRDRFKSWGSMLVLLTNLGAMLPPELANDVLVLDEPLPTDEELQKIVRETFEYAKQSVSDAQVADAVKALIGLPAFPAEQSTAMCLDSKTGAFDIPELWERKRQQINQTRGLSVYTGKDSIDNVGGLHNVKDFLTRIMEGNKKPNCIIFMDEIEKAFAGSGTDSSGVKTELTGQMLSWMEDKGIKGLMFIGVPGVGKSQLPKTLTNKYNVPFVNFNLAAMQDSLVGNSGSFLRSAQATIDAISDGKVLAIATCNSIQSLPPELQSRFQLATFFFDVPDAESNFAKRIERDSIWNVYREQFGIKDTFTNDAGWTGREIKGCCEKAYMLGIPLKDAAKYVVPCVVSNAGVIDNLRRNSSGKYLSASKVGIYQSTVTGPVEVETTGRKMRD